MTVEEELAAYDRVLAYLNGYKSEVTNIEGATADEREKINAELNAKIESYERKRYTAQKAMDEAGIKSVEKVLSARQKLLDEELEVAETEDAKLSVYAKMRRERETELTETLSAISRKYWLSEAEMLDEAERAYETYAGDIKAIDKSVYAARKSLLLDAAKNTYENQKKTLENEYAAQKETLEKRLSAVKDYYDAIDKEETRADRNKQLGDLYAEEEKYRNSATNEGRAKYKSVLDQIDGLKKEEEREYRKEAQTAQETSIKAEMATLEADYKSSLDALAKAYETAKLNADKLAKNMSIDAANGIKSTADELTKGLSGMYAAAGTELDKFSTVTLDKVKALAEKIKSAISGINAMTSGALSQAVSSAVVSNVTSQSRTVNINDYGAKTFNNAGEGLDFIRELGNISASNLGIGIKMK
ncbi:hypothetical protein FACS189490_12870 [Clostridia bacterium]|nr:hypothetical protein FACS189490_12870 [Clostridia bacterium]